MSSKLSFEEDALVDDHNMEVSSSKSESFFPVFDDRQQHQEIESIKSNLPSVHNSISSSSSQLLDLGRTEVNNSSYEMVVKQNQLAQSDDSLIKSVVVEITSSAKSDSVSVTNDLSASQLVDPNVTIQVVNKQMSNWLGRFLETKRTVIDPNSLAPDFEPSSDTYLQEFANAYNSYYKDSVSTLKKQESISDDDSSDEDESPSAGNIIPSGDINDLAFLGTEDVLDMMDNDSSSKLKLLPLSIFNLPYTITVEQVEVFLIKHGVEFSNICLGGPSEGNEKKTTLPLGAASVTAKVQDGKTNDEIIALIQGKPCGGRPVRIQKAYGSLDSRRRSSGAAGSFGRYFERDISTKCHICGEVGHKMQDCKNEKTATPCHLCAGTDHEASECPNLLCYRCSRFGHHSRECRSYGGASRPIACYQCGSIDHIYSQCPQYVYGDPPNDRFASCIDGASIICITCRRTGHAICGSHYSTSKDGNRQGQQQPRTGSNSDIFCPNCGERGHHVDFKPAQYHNNNNNNNNNNNHRGKYWAEDASSLCYAPKCEAFFRFQQLQRDYDELSEGEKNDYYRSIARGAYDLTLFPSLNHPPRYAQSKQVRVGHKRFRESSDDELPGKHSKKTGDSAELINESSEFESSELDSDNDNYSEYDNDEDFDEENPESDDENVNGDGQRARKRQRRDSYNSNYSGNSHARTHERSSEKNRNSKKKQYQDFGDSTHRQRTPSHAHHHKTSKNRKEKRQAKHAVKQQQHEQRRNSKNFADRTQVDQNWNRIRQQQQQQTSTGASAAQAWQDRLQKNQHNSKGSRPYSHQHRK